MSETLDPNENQDAVGKSGIDPELEAAQRAEIERSTAVLHRGPESGGDGEVGQAIRTETARKTAENILNNPDRVMADMDKPEARRTEHDPEKAHLMAMATDKAETYIARDDRRRQEKGQSGTPWSPKREDAELHRGLDQKLASEMYNADPAGAGPNQVERAKEGRKGMRGLLDKLTRKGNW
jgi:hypothetical protein